MAVDSVGIFITYAHNDDVKTTALPDEAGFVSFLYDMLRRKLQELGAAAALFWRDRERIADGDQFVGEIDEGLKKAELLLVVMSKNWMQSPYCQKELEAFIAARKANGVAGVEERIIVIGKDHFDRARRPLELRGQEGFLFYARDEQNLVRPISHFFSRGTPDNRFYDVRDKLAEFLQGRVELIAAGRALGTATPANTPIVRPNNRLVYLSKPATDMKEAYARLALELQGKGFTVVPDIAADIPNDATALDYVNGALAKAEVSIHLLGEIAGFAPERLDPIVKLQLARAREQAAGQNDRDQRAFRRLVWAPKILDAGGATVEPVAARDPLQALARFDAQIATDKIDGDILGKFIEFLFQYLAETAPPPPPPPPGKNQLEIYFRYHDDDEDYAEQIAEALHGSVKLTPPAVGADAETRRFNEKLLQNCDAVTLCWAKATEAWVRSEADKLTDWQSLGRKQQFTYRGLVAGPPPATRKQLNKIRNLVLPAGQIDKIVNLVETGPPTRELLAELIPGGAGPRP
jgi:TIR domain